MSQLVVPETWVLSAMRKVVRLRLRRVLLAYARGVDVELASLNECLLHRG